MSAETNSATVDVVESLRQRKSTIREVELHDFYVDRRFQRAVNPHKVNTIREGYHPQGIGYLLAAHVIGERPESVGDSRYAIIDGQTRWRALVDIENDIANGLTEVSDFTTAVSAEVFEELTPEEAALLFRLRNDQRPVAPTDRDRIAVTEQNPTMVQVVKQSLAAGFVVFPDDDSEPTLPHKTLPVAKRIVAWGDKYKRPNLLTEALVVQAQAFGTEVGHIQAQILQATADLMRKNPNLNEDEMSRILATLTTPVILAQAENLMTRMNKRMHGCLQIVLRDAYNKGKRGDEKIFA